MILIGGIEMHNGLDLLMQTIAIGGAWLAAAFAALGYFGRNKRQDY